MFTLVNILWILNYPNEFACFNGCVCIIMKENCFLLFVSPGGTESNIHI